jgi:hypothetical protein
MRNLAIKVLFISVCALTAVVGSIGLGDEQKATTTTSPAEGRMVLTTTCTDGATLVVRQTEDTPGVALTEPFGSEWSHPDVQMHYRIQRTPKGAAIPDLDCRWLYCFTTKYLGLARNPSFFDVIAVATEGRRVALVGVGCTYRPMVFELDEKRKYETEATTADCEALSGLSWEFWKKANHDQLNTCQLEFNPKSKEFDLNIKVDGKARRFEKIKGRWKEAKPVGD